MRLWKHSTACVCECGLHGKIFKEQLLQKKPLRSIYLCVHLAPSLHCTDCCFASLLTDWCQVIYPLLRKKVKAGSTCIYWSCQILPKCGISMPSHQQTAKQMHLLLMHEEKCLFQHTLYYNISYLAFELANSTNGCPSPTNNMA